MGRYAEGSLSIQGFGSDCSYLAIDPGEPEEIRSVKAWSE